ncbi:uncharacterized protein LOC128668191 [Microplitis demolitor]|uniref:uncharacterized protein LOC128668191 n=1 Tax=Microplitis demolitor TaxID=69319 RepID=UPI00235B5EDA|nr:uncharacterized protein LOC128668191 [Microplitis demolitor]
MKKWINILRLKVFSNFWTRAFAAGDFKIVKSGGSLRSSLGLLSVATTTRVKRNMWKLRRRGLGKIEVMENRWRREIQIERTAEIKLSSDTKKKLTLLQVYFLNKF